MRMYVAMLPAALITLALFCLMQYLITGNRMPVALPDYPGFVNLIRLQQDPDLQDSSTARRALPEQPRVSEDTPQLPQPLAATAATPDFPELSFSMPGLAALDLDNGPYLARPGEHTLTETPQLRPDSRTTQLQAENPAAEGVASNSMPLQAPGLSSITGLSGELTSPVNGGDEVIPLFRIDPDYPRKAARAGEEGWVKIEFTITERGTVVDAVVVEARPRRIFNRSALTAIRKWQFKPKHANGKPVPRKASQVIEFNLVNR
jgi:protein TonB